MTNVLEAEVMTLGSIHYDKGIIEKSSKSENVVCVDDEVAERSATRGRGPQVERGIYHPSNRGPPRRVLLVHEGPPHWLSAVRLRDVCVIHMWGVREIAVEGALWMRYLAFFGGRNSTW